MLLALIYGGLYLEAAAITSLALLISNTRDQFANVSPVVKRTHWVILGFYEIVGMGGFRMLVRFLFNHEKFVASFDEPNAIGISPGILIPSASVLGFIGPAIAATALRLGRCKRRARILFLILVVPVSILYPVIMLAAMRNTIGLNVDRGVEMGIICCFVAFGLFSFWFYNCRAVMQQLKWS